MIRGPMDTTTNGALMSEQQTTDRFGEKATDEEVRQVWLIVALAIARDGLTPPDRLTTDVSRSTIGIGVPGHAAARAWAEMFDGLKSERYQNHREGTDAAIRTVYYHKFRGPCGWMWSVDGDEPLNPPEQAPSAVEVLAEQVIAAVSS